MPLARIGPNKQLLPIDIVAPGRLGINTEQSGALISPDYATDTLNCVLDTNQRLAARFGTNVFTTTPAQTSSIQVTTFSNAQNAVLGLAVVPPSAQGFFVGQTVMITGASPAAFNTTGTIVSMNATTITTTINSLSFGTYSGGSGAIVGLQTMQSIFEYNGGATTGYKTLVSWPFGISAVPTNPANNNIGAAVSNGVSGRWYFQNFNNKVIGFLPGQTPIVWNGTGNFAFIVPSAGSVPTGGIGCCAFGRVWTVQADLQTIQYSGLLNETDWGSSDSGTIDMHTVWSNGTDQVQAICAFNSSLVIFGLKHIVMYTDGRGSLLGLDPTQMYVYDIITGTGCISQFTTQPIGQSDLLFLGPNGVQSLSRLVQNQNNPLQTVTKYIRSQLLAEILQEIPANISSTFDPLQGFYLLALPLSGVVWCLDTRQPYEDQAGDRCSRVTYWQMTATALATTHTPTTFIARTPGQISTYSGFADEGTSYNFNWQSPWMTMSQDPQISTRLKLLKRLQAILITAGGNIVNFGYNTDFSTAPNSSSYNVPSTGGASQYGVAQYGINQYGGGQATALTRVEARARGQYYQFSISCLVNGVMALQQLQAAFKIGRIA